MPQARSTVRRSCGWQAFPWRSISVAHAEDLSTALAAVMIVCAVLFWLGAQTTSIRLDLEKLRSADAPPLWFGVLLVGAALITGRLGYQGVSVSDDGRVSI